MYLREWNKFYLKDVSFVNLMMHHIYNVLIVANPYRCLVFRGRSACWRKGYTIRVYGVQIADTRQLLPKFRPQKRQLESCVQQLWSTWWFVCQVMLIMMLFDVARDIKGPSSLISTVLCSTPFSHGHHQAYAEWGLEHLRFMYSVGWAIPTRYFLTIKLIEDKMNLEHDVQEAGVQMILLVEKPSIRFYGSISAKSL